MNRQQQHHYHQQQQQQQYEKKEITEQTAGRLQAIEFYFVSQSEKLFDLW